MITISKDTYEFVEKKCSKHERSVMKKVISCLACTFFSISYAVEKKAIIIGATSGIGKAVALKLAQSGYTVGVAGRREALLEELKKQMPHLFIKKIDVTRDEAQKKLQELITQMGGMDLMVISISSYNDFTASTSQQAAEQAILDVDLRGFYTMASAGFAFFEQQKSGHLVGISSVDAIRGNAQCPVYSGAKAFIDKYLEGKRNQYLQNHIPITVTDILPGWVDTERKKYSQMPGTYWVASLEKASTQIVNAIKARKKVAYITKRWALIAWLMRTVPDKIYNAIGGF